MKEKVQALIESLLPPSSMKEYREQCQKQDERERQMIIDVRTGCLDAMGLLVDAARNPRISREEIAEAIYKLRNALRWAEELDR